MQRPELARKNEFTRKFTRKTPASKAGASFFLYNRMIIFHTRSMKWNCEKMWRASFFSFPFPRLLLNYDLFSLKSPARLSFNMQMLYNGFKSRYMKLP